MQDGDKTIQLELSTDEGIDRRGMLRCMAWVGTGLVWGVAGGIATV
jgi:3',5'-cyclic-AMP phosphodiesterase